MFFTLSSWELGFFIFVVVLGASALGVLAGRGRRGGPFVPAAVTSRGEARRWRVRQ